MKTSLIQITNKSRESHPLVVKNCTTFLQNFQGLMFTPNLPEYGGILLDEHSDSVVNTSIHMLFMNFDIAAVWIDSNRQVVDIRLARKWKLAYFPTAPARYVLETSTSRLGDFSIGDKLEFTDVS